ncbi:MAG: glycerol kinase GlpK [Planctomycetes bacterium]|nr:glycerol kinase GlpK [Planctomycetota bacterium]
MRCILALDQGTTSSRALLFDREGAVLAVAQREFAQHYPQPGWVEHDAEEIWRTQSLVAVEVLEKAGVRAAEVAAVGLTNQRETCVIWDRRTGEPLHRAIVWQDRRTADRCRELEARGALPLVQERAGLVLDPYFSATKIAWMLDRIPQGRERAARGELAAGTIDTWLAWKLSAGALHVTDASNASRTSLFDLARGAWDAELLALFDVPREILPEVRATSGVLGELRAPGELSGIPLAALVGDQQAALHGQACFAPGLAKNTYGTGCFLLMQTGAAPRRSTHRLLSTVGWVDGGGACFALEGGVFAGGAVLQWLRDGLGLLASAAESEGLARSVPDSAGVFLVPAFAGLGAPHWDPYARGALLGLTRGVTRAHVVRAALEGIAHSVADLVAAMVEDAGSPLAELRVDGGAAANDLLLELQADILGVPVVRPKNLETTAFGAASLAGLAVGFWKDREELARLWRVDRRFEPRMDRATRSALRARWADAVARTLSTEVQEHA